MEESIEAHLILPSKIFALNDYNVHICLAVLRSASAALWQLYRSTHECCGTVYSVSKSTRSGRRRPPLLSLEV